MGDSEKKYEELSRGFGMPIFIATTSRDIVPRDIIWAGLIICWLYAIKSWLIQASGSGYNWLSMNKTAPVMFPVLSLRNSKVRLEQPSHCIFSSVNRE